MKMQLSPQNPELYDVPLEEILEEYIGKELLMDILPVESRWEAENK